MDVLGDALTFPCVKNLLQSLIYEAEEFGPAVLSPTLEAQDYL